MDVRLFPAKLHGAVTPPPSKSQAHRLLLAAGLSSGQSTIRGITHSQDMEATMACLRALGANVERTGDVVTVTGVFAHGAPQFAQLPVLDCCESGSTLRFFIPVALAVAGGGIFTGRGRLLERPQQPYFDLFAEKGISYERTPGKLTVQGTLQPGRYALPGDVSSQFFTGLLYALPLLDGPSTLVSTTVLESAAYLTMTLEALAQAGVPVTETAAGEYQIPGGSTYQPMDAAVEGDWSQAGFFYAAKGLGNDLSIRGMNDQSAQGDRVIASFYKQLCGHGMVTLDVSQCPDLVPPLALHAALRNGETTHIVGAARLRMKESDRLATVTETLNRLGAQITEYDDRLEIHGVETFHGGTVNSHNDHRIAMMAAMAATACDGPVLLEDAGSVKKSYPDFWQVYAALGGRAEEV